MPVNAIARLGTKREIDAKAISFPGAMAGAPSVAWFGRCEICRVRKGVAPRYSIPAAEVIGRW